MLKKIRKNPVINRVFRNLLKYLLKSLDKIRARWRIAGVVDLNFANQYFKFYTQCDDGIADVIFYEKNYVESGDLELFVELAKCSDTILDIGANTGIYSVLSALANPQCRILAFEPYLINYKRLSKNIQINQIKNVSLYQEAIGNEKSQISFYVPENELISDTSSALGAFSESTYEGQIRWKSTMVQQTTLNELAQKHNFNEVNLIKIDVEGYELNVFRGADDFFAKYQPIIFCEIFLSAEKKDFFENFIQKYNYTPYLLLKEGLLRLDDGLTQNFDGLNFLFAQAKTNEVFTSFKNNATIVKQLISTKIV